MKLQNEKLIKRFLFGEMPEEERTDFEDRFITEKTLFEEIRVVEDELIEAFVRGWMKPSERLAFEKSFLTTDKRRDRVEFSQQMFQKIEAKKDVLAAGQSSAGKTETPETIWERLTALFQAPKLVTAAALTLLVGVIGSWVLYSTFSGTEVVKNENTGTVETPANTATPDPTVSPDELPNNLQDAADNRSNPLPEVERSPGKPVDANKKTTKTPSPTATPPPPKAVPNPVLALFSGTLRSGGKNIVLNLPKRAKGAILQLNLENIDYQIYSAQLINADGNVLFQRGNLKAERSRVNLSIPAANLRGGDFIIKLFGKNNSGENESVADFQFRVNK